MGNFKGHSLPGTGFFLVGFLYFLRSTNVSFLLPLRQNKAWILLEPVGKIVGGIAGVVLEWSFMESMQMSTKDHLFVLAIIAGLGFLELFHMLGYLQSPIWPVVNYSGFGLIGLLFAVHEGDSELENWMHKINAVLFLLLVLSKITEVSIGLHTNKEYHKQVKLREKSTFSRRVLFPCCCCCTVPDDGIVCGINSMYTNPTIYSTIFPSLSGILLMLNGQWWWQMAFSLFYYHPENTDHTMNMAHMEGQLHIAMTLFIRHFCVLVTVAALISWSLEWLDRKCCITKTRSKAKGEELQEFLNGHTVLQMTEI